ncbi:hypothetical protein [Enterococcus faecalis]|uniref:hypothetical protein n=1 Tax=Enterococcus faecalis TaxID=1351 RepID=UPI001EFF6D68|nr:hypothetical protein [Enterococcus faecalis]HDT7379375.1 hypothetical protein [Enterococcus faecalis]
MLDMKVLDYRITSDDKQVIVNKARRNEEGELTILTKNGQGIESLALVGYYGDLSKALTAIERDYVLSNGVQIQTIRDYKEALESIHSKLKHELDFGEGF